jgi:uncharacterized membrane protein YdjX (TVP38/TMEM64 family)
MKQIMDVVNSYIELISHSTNPYFAVFLGSFIIILESIIPILPLALFIAINMLHFGAFWGFIISWISTIIGCIISFQIFRHGFYKYLYGKLIKYQTTDKIIDRIGKMSFSSLVLIAALPFTPAFSINIAAGLSKMPLKKFIYAMAIAKISIVYFWGYIGTSLIQSITNTNVLIKIVIIFLITHGISVIVRKRFNIE